MTDFTSNSFRVSDLEAPASGKFFASIDADGIEWHLEICSEEIPDSPGPPYFFLMSAPCLEELKTVKFSLGAEQFDYRFSGSDSFGFACGTDVMFVKKLDYRLQRHAAMPILEMNFFAKGKLDANWSPDYMRDLYGEIAVQLKFEYFQCLDSKSIDEDIQRIRELSGMQSIVHLEDGLNGDRSYGVILGDL